MEYLSARETAAKWQVSSRVVQEYCKNGRIAGACKCGVVWLIPASAEKPLDPRRQKKLQNGCLDMHQDRQPKTQPAKRQKIQPTGQQDTQPQIQQQQQQQRRQLPIQQNGAASYIFLTAADLPKGDPDAVLPALPAKYRALAAADIAYRRGDPEPAKENWRATDCLDETKLSAASLATAAAISSGDYVLYYEIESYLQSCLDDTSDAKARALLSLPSVLAAVSMAAPDLTPQWLQDGDFSLFPQELAPFLLYLHTLHLRNIGNSAAVLATARAAALLCARTDTFTWLDINFLLLCASASYSLGDTGTAMRYLNEAFDLGMPCGFIAHFADCLGDFGGRLEIYTKQRCPQYLAQLIQLWNSSFKNWMCFHNQFTRENITTILTAQEYHVAQLLVQGASYAAAAQQLELSAGRIKNITLDIYGKLYIQKRSQLRQFIL